MRHRWPVSVTAVNRVEARSQSDLDIVADGAVAIRDGVIAAVGTTDEVLATHADGDVPTIDARGRCVLPGLVECHSHPLFDGDRHHEYAERLGGASLAEVAARGGGIWSSVVATRSASDEVLLARLATTLQRILAGGVTTLEVKSGYGLTVAEELRQLELLRRATSQTADAMAITFLGAHVVPRDLDGEIDGRPSDRAEFYTSLIDGEMLPAVVAQGIAEFQDVTVEEGYFTPDQALRLMRRSHQLGLPVRVHADAWAPSLGWRTAVEGGAVSAEHLTYTSADEIRDVGRTDTVAVVLPMAELVYMTSRRANARLFIEQEVPVAVATDFCSSIHATSLLNTDGHGRSMVPNDARGSHRRGHAQCRLQSRPTSVVWLARRRQDVVTWSSSTAPIPTRCAWPSVLRCSTRW